MKNYGSISKRKNGTYMGRVMYKGTSKTFYSKNKDELQDKMNEFVMSCKYQITKVKEVPAAIPATSACGKSTMIFSEYSMQYITTYKLNSIKASSYDRLESILKCHVIGSAIDIPICELDDIMLQRFLVSKSDSCSRSTVKKIYDLLKSVLFYAYRKKDIDVDISTFLRVPKSKKDTKSIECYTPEDINALVVGIKDGVYSKDYRDRRRYRYAFAYLIIYHTGLRAGELLALRRENIDLVNRKIYVKDNLVHIKNRDDHAAASKYLNVIESVKTDASNRVVPINQECYEYITYLLLDDIQSDYLVHNLDGDVLKFHSFQQTFKRICIDLGVKHKGLHALRHTFASTLIHNGVDANVVSRLLGHTSVTFTYDRYVHPYEDEYKDAVNVLMK